MRFVKFIFAIVFMLSVLGCEEAVQGPADTPARTFSKTCIFVPQKINFNQLTAFAQPWQITAYIDMLDQFGSRIKAAGIWQFELYEYAPRSSKPTGSRLYAWPEIDLTNADKNFSLWQDYLRCYKFDLNLEANLASGKAYILQAVCFTAEGKRLTGSFELKL